MGAIVIALIVFLFPPWRAQAIRTTTRYAAVAGVEPSTVVDTITWPLQFAPIFAPPRPAVSGNRMRELAGRSVAGDTSARATLRAETRDAERRVRVPEVLRTEGALWRDSVLTAAGMPATTSYELTFGLDERWLAARLAVVALTAFMLDLRGRRRAYSRKA